MRRRLGAYGFPKYLKSQCHGIYVILVLKDQPCCQLFPEETELQRSSTYAQIRRGKWYKHRTYASGYSLPEATLP